LSYAIVIAVKRSVLRSNAEDYKARKKAAIREDRHCGLKALSYEEFTFRKGKRLNFAVTEKSATKIAD
jgi:hypothetical protein